MTAERTLWWALRWLSMYWVHCENGPGTGNGHYYRDEENIAERCWNHWERLSKRAYAMMGWQDVPGAVFEVALKQERARDAKDAKQNRLRQAERVRTGPPACEHCGVKAESWSGPQHQCRGTEMARIASILSNTSEDFPGWDSAYVFSLIERYKVGLEDFEEVLDGEPALAWMAHAASDGAYHTCRNESLAKAILGVVQARLAADAKEGADMSAIPL